MVARIGRMAPLALAFLALGTAPSVVRAQANSTFNPYGNSGYADYREFGNPSYSNNPSLPGQARLNSEPIITRPRANSFQQYSDELEGFDAAAGPSPSRGSAANAPYFRAYRQFDKEYDRVYRPNAVADKGFEARLRERDQAYARAMREPDPAVRARLLRQLERDSLDRPAPAAARARPAAGARPRAAGTAPPPPTASRAPRPDGTRNPRTNPPAAPSTRAPSPAPARSVPPPDPSTIATPPPR